MNGIDVSSNNGVIDWAKVKQNVIPIDFAIIKASEGVGYVDPKLKANATGADKAGIKKSYYHFASLNTLNDIPDAKAEADFFLSTIKSLPKNDFSLVLDIETNKVGLDKIHVLEWIKTFFSEMKSHGYDDCILYSYSSFLDSNLSENHGLCNKLWIAAYVNLPSPKLPKGWNEYLIWQKNSTSKIFGIQGNVDFNVTTKPIF